MSDEDLQRLLNQPGVGPRRLAVARWVESMPVQFFIIALILLNAGVLGLETDAGIMERFGRWLVLVDKLCLAVFVIELVVKMSVYRLSFFRSGWSVFDFVVVGIALVPSAGPWSVLRALRVLRVLRLFTMVPALKKVVAAFLHSIPGLMGVVSVMAIFFYVCGVLATRLFGEAFPAWFGSLGASLYSLFQIMTLESWSMGIVRPVMEVYPMAWAFFVPFIVIATFTILNLFIGIIVSTMQELSEQHDAVTIPAIGSEGKNSSAHLAATLDRMERDLAELRQGLVDKN